MPRMIAIVPARTLQAARVVLLKCSSSQTQKVIPKAPRKIRIGVKPIGRPLNIGNSELARESELMGLFA